MRRQLASTPEVIDWTSRWVVRCAARAGLFIAFGVFFWFTKIRLHTYDGWTYVMSAQVGSESLFHLLFPHHLAYHPLMYGVARVAEGFGYSGGSLVPLEIANVLLASACLVLFYGTCRRYFDRSISLGLTAVLSVSNAYWLYASEVEVYHLSLFFQLILVNLLLSLYGVSKLSLRVLLPVALTLWISVLAHQTNLLLAFLVSVVVLTHSSPLRSRARNLLMVGLATSALLLVSYGLAILILGYRSIRDIAFWFTAYANLETWGKLTASNPGDSLATQVSSFVQMSKVGLSVLVLAALSFIVISLVAVRRDLELSRICLAWYMPNLLFFSWWEPGNKEFWISALPPLLLLLGLATCYGKQRGQKITRVVIAAVLPLLVWVNWSNSLAHRQDPELDIRTQASQTLADCLPEGLLIVANNYAFPWQAYYFHPGQVKMLDFYFFLPDSVTKGISQLDSDVEETLENDKPVFVTQEAVQLTTRAPVFYGREVKAMRGYFEKFSLRNASCTYLYGEGIAQGVFELVPSPTPDSG